MTPKPKVSVRRMWAAKEDIILGEDETVTLRTAHGKGRVSSDWQQAILVTNFPGSLARLRAAVKLAGMDRDKFRETIMHLLIDAWHEKAGDLTIKHGQLLEFSKAVESALGLGGK